MTQLQLQLIMTIALWCGNPSFGYSNLRVNACREILMACLEVAAKESKHPALYEKSIACFKEMKL